MADQTGRDRLTRGEILKDAAQSTVEATASAVGQATTVVTRAVGEMASIVGDLATEVFEIRDASRRAALDHADPDHADRADLAAAEPSSDPSAQADA